MLTLSQSKLKITHTCVYRCITFSFLHFFNYFGILGYFVSLRCINKWIFCIVSLFLPFLKRSFSYVDTLKSFLSYLHNFNTAEEKWYLPINLNQVPKLILNRSDWSKLSMESISGNSPFGRLVRCVCASPNSQIPLLNQKLEFMKKTGTET